MINRFNFFNNKMFFLFLIILLLGFICIGSSFAVNIDDSYNTDTISDGNSLHISVNNANRNNDLIIKDVDYNVPIESYTSKDLSLSKSSNINNLIGSKSSDNNQSTLSNKVYVDSEKDIRDALKNKYSEIILTSNINVNKVIEISRANITIDGNGHNINTGEKSSKNIFVINSCNCTICNCIFNNRVAKNCVAIYSQCNGITNVINCTFDGYSSKKEGAAISLRSFPSGHKIVNCSFTNCNATKGGAIYISSCISEVVNCSFTNCNATKGGAIYLDGFKNNSDNYEVVNCSFTGCSADERGGAIYVNSPKSTVVNCSFTGCSADERGGAIYLGDHKGYVYKCIFRNITTKDTHKSKNQVIFCYQLDSVIKNSTFYVEIGDDVIKWDQPWYNFAGILDEKKGVEDHCIFHWLTIRKK